MATAAAKKATLLEPPYPPSHMVNRFFRGHLVHAKDAFAGKPFRLEDWQLDEVIVPVYDTLRMDKGDLIREVTEALIGVPKKNGKTHLAAGLGAYGLVADGHWRHEGGMWRWVPTMGGEVYNVAGSRDQAKILFKIASGFVQRSPMLRAMCRVYKDAIEVTETESVWRVLAADAGLAHGPNPSTAIIDEIWVHKDPELYEALASAGAARRQPLLITITTAGFDQSSIAWRLYQRGKRNRSKQFYFRWWEMPRGSKIDDSKAWRVANPSRWVTTKYLRTELKRAREVGNEAGFWRFHGNAWRGGKELAIPLEVWERGNFAPKFDRNLEAVITIDSAPKSDSTAIAVTQKNPETDVIQAIVLKLEPDPATGYLDYTGFKEAVRVFASRFQVKRVLSDPYNLVPVMFDLMEEGLPVEMFPQNDALMVPASMALYEVLVQERLAHGGILVDEVQAAAKRTTERGWRLAKRTSSGKIDGLVALAMGVYVWEKGDEPEKPKTRPSLYVPD